MTPAAPAPRNEPIAYDDHGDIPFEVPFAEIPASAISIYLQLDTRVGRATCGQACGHCFYINQPETRNRSMSLQDGRRVMEDVARRGYRVFPMISDSLANGGEFLEVFGNSHNRDLRQEIDRRPTKTMERGEMWTSGAALLRPEWRALLQRGIDHGFGSVTITFHGLLGDDLAVLPPERYPISGVFPGRDCERVIARIHDYNRELRARGSDARLDVNVGVTIGKHNHDHASLLRYARYFNERGVAVVRFNCFHDHGWRYPGLVMSDAEIAQVFASLRSIHAHEELRFQLGLDEDFGTSGIEVMGFPAHTGWCRAGRQLFAFVPEPPVILEEDGGRRRERLGPLAGCVDAFKPIVGYIVRETDKASGRVDHDVVFLPDAIDELTRKRLDGTYRNGCFAGEMLAELRPSQGARPLSRRGKTSP